MMGREVIDLPPPDLARAMSSEPIRLKSPRKPAATNRLVGIC